MQDHKDQEFLGVISGVTEWGIYVEIVENKCEGMVRIREIKEDYYTFDEKQYALVGQATQGILQLGDEVFVKVKIFLLQLILREKISLRIKMLIFLNQI